MTKETYYDMCEQLGSNPIDEEVPVEISDLPTEAVQAWMVYEKLPGDFDSFSGNYLGKHLEHVPVMLDLLDISVDRLVLFNIINLFDRIEKEEIRAKIEQQRASQSNKKGK